MSEKRYESFNVVIPDMLRNTKESRSPVCVHTTLYVDGDSLVFDARSLSSRPWLQPKAHILDVYASMCALAYALRWIKGPSDSPNPEINLPNIKRFFAFEQETRTEHISLARDQIQEVATRYFGPKENHPWKKIEGAVIKQIEDHVELTSFVDRDYLLIKARSVLDKKDGRVDHGDTYYDFSVEELSFAPNTNWAIWALSNARDVSKFGRPDYYYDPRTKKSVFMWRRRA